jgi:hypothetical protein
MALTPAQAQEVTKENVQGIVNFHRMETTAARSGAIKPEALPNIKKMGIGDQFARTDRAGRERRNGGRGGQLSRRHYH